MAESRDLEITSIIEVFKKGDLPSDVLQWIDKRDTLLEMLGGILEESMEFYDLHDFYRATVRLQLSKAKQSYVTSFVNENLDKMMDFYRKGVHHSKLGMKSLI